MEGKTDEKESIVAKVCRDYHTTVAPHGTQAADSGPLCLARYVCMFLLAARDQLVVQVQQYFFDDDSFIVELEKFAREHCDVIDLSQPDTEHKLE